MSCRRIRPAAGEEAGVQMEVILNDMREEADRKIGDRKIFMSPSFRSTCTRRLSHFVVTWPSRNPPHPSPLPKGEGEPSSVGRRTERYRNLESQPLLPPLPKGEGESSSVGRRTERYRNLESRPLLPPLPLGEGWGEGDLSGAAGLPGNTRVRVKTGCGPSRCCRYPLSLEGNDAAAAFPAGFSLSNLVD